MAGFMAVFLMAAFLGVASFGTGMLPLSVAFSKSSLVALSAFGNGLLLGAALGVIIPEGVETLISSTRPPTFHSSTMALSLIAGFTFMLIVERQLSPHSHSHTPPDTSGRQQPRPADVSSVSVEFDMELGDLERAEGFNQAGSLHSSPSRNPVEYIETRHRAYPLTLGLVVHALADGLALGSAALSGPASGDDTPSETSMIPSNLSLVVFLALLVHKAPTALALTTSLLSTSLPVGQCKRHLAIFSASTPFGTLLSYALLSFFGAESHSPWPGVALLFSGGSFLYVATVLQPSLAQAHSAMEEQEDIGGRSRLFLTIGGMLAPYAIATMIGGEHGHGHA